VNPFLREHAGSLVGSTLLHILIAAAALAAAWYTVAPKITMPAAIDAYIAAPRAPRAQPPPQAQPAPPAPAPVAPPAPAPDPAAEARAREDARAREQAAAAREQAHEGELRAEAAARQKAAEEAARRSAAQDAQRRADAEAERRRAAALEAKRADDRRKAAADAQQRAARESDLARQLAAEEQRAGAENSGLLARYVAEIQARIERAWNRPPTAKPGLRCTVYVTQVPGGTVTDVKIGECNGDAAVQQSITLAVYRASPLPAPPDPSLFERNLRLVFAPDA
jgi:colicin import membrane protein